MAELCARLPLALRIAASNLAGRAGEVGEYAARLQGGNRLASLAADDDGQTAVRATFDLSYTALTEQERRLFRLLGLVPGPGIGPETAAALVGTTADEADRLLDRLAGAHLVNERAPGRYRLHDLLRIYATERAAAEEGEAGSRDATARLFNSYLHTADLAANVLYPHMLRLPLPVQAAARNGFRDHAEAVGWFDAERPNLVAAVDRAAADGMGEVAWQLAHRLHGYFWLVGADNYVLRGEAAWVIVVEDADESIMSSDFDALQCVWSGDGCC